MSTNEESQKAKAMRLRQQIKQIINPEVNQIDSQSSSDDASPKNVTPRDFIHRRMREIDSDEK
jgi:hypothetical protein